MPGYVPEGADPRGILQPPADGDITVTNSAGTPNPSVQIWAENNYWGGPAPVFSNTARGFDVFVPAGSNVTYRAPGTYLPIMVDPLSWAPR